ncbi:MAG: lytic transglycosylase domain-containing protein [Candidatus Abyssobacteria bacterium SURF_17]|uniref:Lytic transglycosylase domain-containing protein n=1 Tax=Candidatus Abyssobacteria bacterium SURF_17 TaxID=2093361 RepID=A0A419EYV6_9BACT|nr:MAG: lytic transglycosylase domain-containing protein [Candidatus Abyssubacteria bacterium SURF_17]
MIFDLAKDVDPHSASVSNSKRTCDEYVAAHPEKENEESFERRQLPRSLYGKHGKPPDIFVYQHNSGLLLLTSKVKDLGPDYVLLNFEPIRKIKKDQVVKTIKGEPQVEVFDLDEIIRIYAREYKVSPALVKAVIKAESDFDPYAVSSAGARGLMQLMPSTALEMQVDDIFDPVQNVAGGVQYLARMLELFNNDERLALAAYNAGPGNVLRYGGVPPFKETKAYVPKVLNYYDRYKSNPSPVKLKVALNKKPSMEYLPDVQVVEEFEVEVTVSSPRPASPTPSKDYVTVYLKNGNTMRGKAYEKMPTGIRLKFENGSIFIREEMVTKIL